MTVTVQVAFALPQVAVITALPAPTAVTLPLTTVATCVSELLHSTVPFAVATSVVLSPTSRLREVLSSVTVGVGGGVSPLLTVARYAVNAVETCLMSLVLKVVWLS